MCKITESGDNNYIAGAHKFAPKIKKVSNVWVDASTKAHCPHITIINDAQYLITLRGTLVTLL